MHATRKHTHAVLSDLDGEGGAVGDGYQLVHRTAAGANVHVDFRVVTETVHTILLS